MTDTAYKNPFETIAGKIVSKYSSRHEQGRTVFNTFDIEREAHRRAVARGGKGEYVFSDESVILVVADEIYIKAGRS